MVEQIDEEGFHEQREFGVVAQGVFVVDLLLDLGIKSVLKEI